MLLSLNGISQTAPGVDSVDLNRYSGLWYEIAVMGSDIDKGCRCPTEEFEYIPGRKYVTVIDKCIRFKNGRSVISEKKMKAFIFRTSANKMFKLQFLWPLRSEYEIISLNSEYSWTVISFPHKETLYILYRDSFMPGHKFNEVMHIIKDKGYNTSSIQKTLQNCDIIE